ncbi:hypothetical protein FRC96_19390 [Lujinxingia vulgaris]|uniref:Uncharacterized protein n=1 Tax=Lujinxingia vulgaris TaxID=2600176 RepID=A0A5C6WTW2_9DELT|nr:hypothetical protein [Lujinxingia vulgaris]TXD31988.1 hypothetical protein FRC96_19390 [Lujinxingia vulgaris]
MKTSHLLSVFTTAALCLVACAPPEGPRELPAPRLDLSRIFPQTDATAALGTDLTTSEERFRQLADAPDPSPAAHSRIRIPLGASLSGELPHSPDWSWSQRTGLTLISHQSAAPHPDILILAQPYSPARAQRPSQALHNFIDELLPDASPLSLTSIAGDLPQLATELQSLQTALTGGRGLGFSPSPDTFSGWRTIGQNASGTHIRLAHYDGTWTSQPNLPVGLTPQSISSLSLQLAKNLPAGLIPEDRLNESLNMLESLSTPSPSATGSTPQARRPPESARLIVSTIEASPSQGLHLALLCSGTTSCPQAPHITRFLESISSDGVPTSAPTLSLAEHSQQLQITLP